MKQSNYNLDRLTRPGDLVVSLDDDSLLCTACGHRCKLRDGQRGICKVRFNSGGVLQVPFNYAAGIQNDPIEKKPFFHAYPGSMAMSFGMLGCDFHCSYCQNWFTSQSLRDESATTSYKEVYPEEICRLALENGAKTVVSTYNEPLITSEWAVAVFREAKQQGLATAYVSNGNGTPEVLEYLRPWLDFYKVDLKSFNPKNYRRLGGQLEDVLETIQRVYDIGFWLEIVTLLIPDYNDSDEELAEMAGFISEVSKDIPWHVTAFHPDYKMQDRGRTPVKALLKARDIGQKAGLKFIYSGNLPGRVGDTESTFCPKCNELLIKRQGFTVLSNRMKAGHCPKCEASIPGQWA